nr:RHS repeat-associated core domain-containing protein [Prevotella sp. oral taxon 472]
MAWDEENRLMALSDNDKTSRYTYNAASERIVKSHGYLEGVYVNGAPQGLTFHETEDYTIYPAPILSVTRRRFTKHYFIGDRRIASKIGAGIFQNAYGRGANVVTAGQKDYQMRMMQIEKQREDYYRKLGTPPGVPTIKGATAEPENTHEGYNTIIKELGDHSVPDGWIQRPKRNAVPGTPPGPPVQWDMAEDPDDVQPGYGYVPADTTHHEDIFFYHTDHLGSTSYITDAKANVAQFDAYLPYGELLVDEHSSPEEMPYKFNGKEFDEETGLYYYGARYMNPRTSLWYGVDPLVEKYPSIGAYCYTFGNPLRFIDPTGMAPTEEEAARIADHVYGTGKVRLTGGWKVSKIRFKNVTLKDDRSGFRSELYERTVKGKTEYVYATAGTDFSSLEDWKNDAQQIVGCSKQYEMSMQNAEQLSKAIDKKELTFVGHSLGGGLAAANAFKTGRRAMTFNAAWVSPFTISWWNRKKARIDTFIHYNDELNNFQVHVLNVWADGTQHWRYQHNSMLGHSIQNFYKPDPKPASETLDQKIQNAQQQYIMNRQNLPFSF